jgi:hypothetical protein
MVDPRNGRVIAAERAGNRRKHFAGDQVHGAMSPRE